MIRADGTSTIFSDTTVEQSSDNELVANLDMRRVCSSIVMDHLRINVFYDGFSDELYLPQTTHETTDASENSVVTPMPCKISHVQVKAGDVVKKGQLLLVLEAMKMEHSIKAPRDGVVLKVNCKQGDLVAQGKTLVSFEQDKE